MDVEIFTIADTARLAEALGVRVAVFVDEQRVPADEEVDEHDRSDALARHALVRDREPVGAGRSYHKDERTVQIGRMAVLPAHRGRGIGRRILDALLADARRRGYTRASLNAQTHAAAFYRAAGFRAYGPEFLECDIVHQAMERDLEPLEG